MGCGVCVCGGGGVGGHMCILRVEQKLYVLTTIVVYIYNKNLYMRTQMHIYKYEDTHILEKKNITLTG